MAYTKIVTSAVAVAGVCTLTILNTDIEDYYINDKVRVEGISNVFNGTHTLTAVNLEAMTVTFLKGNSTVSLTNLRGAEIYVVPKWTDEDLVLSWLGITEGATANDTAFVTECVEASNQWCFRKRQEAGYKKDRVTFPPSGDVQQAATMFAAALYRERGSLDSFQSYEMMATASPTGSLGQIMRLLGCGRATVA